MRYILVSSDEVTRVWLRAFEALSLTHFGEISKYLGFTAIFSDELRKCAKDFTLLYYQAYLGKLLPEQPSIQLLETTDENVIPLVIWRKTFSELQEIGYAERVYEWVKWLEKLENFQTDNRINPISHWDSLLEDLSLDPTNIAFASLPLSTLTKLSIEAIVLRETVKSHKACNHIAQIKRSSQKNTWEQYAFDVLGIDSWIAIQAQSIIHERKWKQLLNLLSDEEIKVLEEWGGQHFKKINIDRYPALKAYAYPN